MKDTTGLAIQELPQTGISTPSRVGVVGVGMVGSQVAEWFKTNLVYDKYKDLGSIELVNEADIIFVCVDTPYAGASRQYDLSALEEVVGQIEDGKTIVVKSTVNPGTTDYFQDKYPDKTFLFNPEFLTELSAENDFRHPDVQIIGATWQAYDVASKIMLMLPPAPVMRIISPIDAEYVKKVRNAFYALKVIFFNEIYDMAEKTLNADYETIRSVVVEDPKIGNSHSFIFHKGYRGFGGACLPKDLYSLIDFAEEWGKDPELLKKVQELNRRLGQG